MQMRLGEPFFLLFIQQELHGNSGHYYVNRISCFWKSWELRKCQRKIIQEISAQHAIWILKTTTTRQTRMRKSESEGELPANNQPLFYFSLFHVCGNLLNIGLIRWSIWWFEIMRVARNTFLSFYCFLSLYQDSCQYLITKLEGLN